MSHTRLGLFSASSGMAEDLYNNNFISLSTWGTDKDIKDCLGRDLINRPVQQIRTPGTYVLPPVSLTEEIDAAPSEAIKHHLTESLQAIKDNHIHGKVTLLIPTNTDNHHWRLVKITLDDQQLQSVVFWDPLAGSPKASRALPAFKNLRTACLEASLDHQPIFIRLKFAGIQHNSHSCMDYVLQKIYLELHCENAITQASDDQSLRLAVVRQIALSHAHLRGIADDLHIQADGITTINSPENEKTGDMTATCLSVSN